LWEVCLWFGDFCFVGVGGWRRWGSIILGFFKTKKMKKKKKC